MTVEELIADLQKLAAIKPEMEVFIQREGGPSFPLELAVLVPDENDFVQLQ